MGLQVLIRIRIIYQGHWRKIDKNGEKKPKIEKSNILYTVLAYI